MISAFGVDHGTISKSDKRDAAIAAGAGVGAGAAGAGGSAAMYKAGAKKLKQSDQNLVHLTRFGKPPKSKPVERATYLKNAKNLVRKPAKQGKMLTRGSKAVAALGAAGAVGGVGVAANKLLKDKE